MTDMITERSDYKEDIDELQKAVDSLNEPDKKTEIAGRLLTLRQEITAQRTSEEIRASINSLKRELNVPVEIPSQNEKLSVLKNTMDNEMKGLLQPVKLAKFLKELPPENMDPTGRAFRVQYILGKLRSYGYNLIIEAHPGGISLRTDKESLKQTAIILQETLESHAQAQFISRSDIEQALTIGSGSLSQYRDIQAKPNELNTNGYYDFLIKKYRFDQNMVTTDNVQSAKDIPENEKAFLISYLSGGIVNKPLTPILEKYDTMQKEAKEVLDSSTFKAAQKTVDAMTGIKTPAMDSKELAKKITEDPSSALSGKPMTTLALGAALIFGLGGGGSKEGFSLWKGLTRGFMGLIALFLGAGVAKEWGMDPKKLLKDGMDMMKDGGKKAGEAVAGATPGLAGSAANEPQKPVVKAGEKLAEKPALTPSQTEATKTVNSHKILSESIARHSESHKGQPGGGTLEQYFSFINSPEFQGQKLKNIIYTTDPESSIFNEKTGKFELGITIPAELDHKILKKVLRTYLTGNPDINYVEGNKGKKEQEALEVKISAVKDQKEMTIANSLSKIYIPQ